jgi:hypothetical protein
MSTQLQELEKFGSTKDDENEISGMKRNIRGNLVHIDPHRRRLKNHVPMNIPSARFLINPPGGYVYMPNSDPRFSFPRDLSKAASTGQLEKFRQMHIDHMSEDCVFMNQCDGNFNPYGPLQREIYGTTYFYRKDKIIILTQFFQVISTLQTSHTPFKWLHQTPLIL